MNYSMTPEQITIFIALMPVIGGIIGWMMKGKTNAAALKKIRAESNIAEASSFKMWIDLYKDIADNVKIELEGALKEAQELRSDIQQLKKELAMVVRENVELKNRLNSQ